MFGMIGPAAKGQPPLTAACISQNLDNGRVHYDIGVGSLLEFLLDEISVPYFHPAHIDLGRGLLGDKGKEEPLTIGAAPRDAVLQAELVNHSIEQSIIA